MTRIQFWNTLHKRIHRVSTLSILLSRVDCTLEEQNEIGCACGKSLKKNVPFSTTAEVEVPGNADCQKSRNAVTRRKNILRLR